jgi:hypothetical protein
VLVCNLHVGRADLALAEARSLKEDVFAFDTLAPLRPIILQQIIVAFAELGQLDIAETLIEEAMTTETVWFLSSLFSVTISSSSSNINNIN